MISIVQNLHAGNALRLFIEPPPGAVRWKILRKGSDTFTGIDDPSALVAYEGDDLVIVDSESLQNEVMAFYKAWFLMPDATWAPTATAFGTPTADYQEYTTDVLSKVRDRLEVGLKVECDRGNFAPELGYIQVYTAAPSMERDLRFPLVTIHMEEEASDQRAIGETISGDEFDSIGMDWNESEGWLATVNLTIIGWSTNSDERIELRKAIRRLVIANLPVFSACGFEQVHLSQQDVDAVNGEYPALIYQVMNTLSCLAPVRVGGDMPAISEVISRSING